MRKRRIEPYFKWLDFRIGFYYNRTTGDLYIGYLPTLGVRVNLLRRIKPSGINSSPVPLPGAPIRVRVVKPFKAARTPCPPAGTEGKWFGTAGLYRRVRFQLPFACTEGQVWTNHFGNNFMDLKFLESEIEISDQSDP